MLAQWPALEGMNVAQTYFVMKGCALRPPHTHQRATGLLYVIQGEPLFEPRPLHTSLPAFTVFDLDVDQKLIQSSRAYLRRVPMRKMLASCAGSTWRESRLHCLRGIHLPRMRKARGHSSTKPSVVSSCQCTNLHAVLHQSCNAAELHLYFHHKLID